MNNPWYRLHSHLRHLRTLLRSEDARPVMLSLEQAEEEAARRTEQTGKLHVATPVWRIQHDELEASEPVGWSWSEWPS